MKIIDNRENGGEEFVSLTFEEEKSFARSVMDAMADRRIWGDFQTLLDRIYFLKCTRGYQITTDDFVAFLDFADRYHTTIPDLVDDGQTIREEIGYELFNSDYEKYSEEQRRMIVLAWKEAWDSHDSVKRVADGYKRFPTDKEFFGDHIPEDVDAHIAEQDAAEEAFWKEVDKIMKDHDYRCTRQEAYTMASDYMMRGDYSALE